MTSMISAVNSSLRLKAQPITLSAPVGRKRDKPAFTEWAEKIAAGDRLPRGYQFRIIQRWRDFSGAINTNACADSTVHMLPRN